MNNDLTTLTSEELLQQYKIAIEERGDELAYHAELLRRLGPAKAHATRSTHPGPHAPSHAGKHK